MDSIVAHFWTLIEPQETGQIRESEAPVGGTGFRKRTIRGMGEIEDRSKENATGGASRWSDPYPTHGCRLPEVDQCQVDYTLGFGALPQKSLLSRAALSAASSACFCSHAAADSINALHLC